MTMLTGTICMAVLISILTAAIKSEELSEGKTKTLAAIVSSAMAAITLYIGNAMALRREQITGDQEKDEEPTKEK